jgi:hypothetical protein
MQGWGSNPILGARCNFLSALGVRPKPIWDQTGSEHTFSVTESLQARICLLASIYYGGQECVELYYHASYPFAKELGH